MSGDPAQSSYRHRQRQNRKPRPHQRPILTRFAFVMPIKSIHVRDGANSGERTIPCEPEEANIFLLMAWEPEDREFVEVGSFMKLTYGEDAYSKAMARSVTLDAEIAARYGERR